MLVVSRKMGQYWKKETLNFLISYRWNKYLSTKFYSFLLGKNINLPVAKKKKIRIKIIEIIVKIRKNIRTDYFNKLHNSDKLCPI